MRPPLDPILAAATLHPSFSPTSFPQRVVVGSAFPVFKTEIHSLCPSRLGGPAAEMGQLLREPVTKNDVASPKELDLPMLQQADTRAGDPA